MKAVITGGIIAGVIIIILIVGFSMSVSYTETKTNEWISSSPPGLENH